MTQQVNITANRIEVIDGEVSAHLDFYQPISEEKVDAYVAELKQECVYKKAHLEQLRSVPSLVVTDYKLLRSFEYPPMTDYIDGVVKGDQAQIDAYIAACQAVKAKYPKPE